MPNPVCSGCDEPIVLVGDQLPSDAHECSCGRPKHRKCECFSELPEFPKIDPIVTPLASVDRAMEQHLPPLEYAAWRASCEINQLRDDIADCADLDDLRVSAKLLDEVRESISERLSDIRRREVELTMVPLGRAS